MHDLEQVLEDYLQSGVDVDFTVLDGLDVLDETINVGLNDLDLLPGQSEERTQKGQESVQGSLQLGQQSVKVGRRFVR